MKKNTLVKGLVLLLTLTSLIFSCKQNDDDAVADDNSDNNSSETLSNITTLTQSVNILSDLVDALELSQAGLLDDLASETGNFTVFAPSNDAFDALFDQLEGFSDLDDFDEEAELTLLSDILRYHIVPDASLFSSDLSEGVNLTTLQGESLTVRIDGSIFIADATEELAEIVGADNEASNGVVHIISKILLPQSVLDALLPPLPSIFEWVSADDSLSLLEEAILAAGLEGDLGNDEIFTLFAPTNEAFTGLFEALGDGFNSFSDFDNPVEIAILRSILNYHLVSGQMNAAALTPGEVSTLANGETIEIIASGDTFVIGDATDSDANLLSTDNFANNGVVHTIDKILIPQEIADLLDSMNPDTQTIAELVTETEGLEFIEEALVLTGLLETLDGNGPFTVFAPSNESLTNLLALFGGTFTGIEDFDNPIEIALLRAVLQYHILPIEVRSSDLELGEVNTLLNGNSIEVIPGSAGPVLRDATGFNANFVLNDIEASNGVIHIVDRILIPQFIIDVLAEQAENFLLDAIASLEDITLNSLILALVQVDQFLRDTLDETIPTTCFTPTNTAFLELFENIDGIEDLSDFDTQDELRLLAQILSHHIVIGNGLLAGQLNDGQTLATLEGSNLTIRINNEVFIEDATDDLARVIREDITVGSTVIHVIDKVLIPQVALGALTP